MLVIGNKKLIQTFFIAICLTLGISACMLGPNFSQPISPKVNHYTKSPQPTKTTSAKDNTQAGKTQYLISGKDISGEWWYLFHSPEINFLIRTGLANSPNLASAKAALLQAQENLYAQIGSTMFPAINAGISGERQRFSSNSF